VHEHYEVNVNWEQIEGKWNQLKGAVKQRWGKLTDDDLDVIAGKKDELLGKLQEKYGITKEQAEKELEQWSAAPTSATGPESERERKVS
jgi:uncharacterized protein YjbJ (UPF0337 family)